MKNNEMQTPGHADSDGGREGRVLFNPCLAFVILFLISGLGPAAAEERWEFETDIGAYELTSPTTGSVRITTDGGNGVTNTTAFTHGHKLTTVFPPGANGDYTAALVYGRAEPFMDHGNAAAKYVEKGRNDVNWSAPQDIGEVFLPSPGGAGKGINGYLASDGLGNVYLAFTDATGTLVPAAGANAAYVVKKHGPGAWTASSTPELVFEDQHLGDI